METAPATTAPLTQEMKATVEKQRLGFVATVSATGEPNVSPKGRFIVVDDRTLAFGDVRSPGTIANIRHRRDVEVNFVDPLSRKGFRAKGTATVHVRGSDTYRELCVRASTGGELWRNASSILC